MQIRQLTITRYRGIKQLKWKPSRGFNCLIGPGDTGTSTILTAIGLLLEPRPSLPATEYDYFNRDLTNGFEIEAVLAGVQLDSERVPLLRGWRDGEVTAMPESDDEPVLMVAVRGNADLEVTHVIVGPDDETRPGVQSSVRALAQAHGVSRYNVRQAFSKDDALPESDDVAFTVPSEVAVEAMKWAEERQAEQFARGQLETPDEDSEPGEITNQDLHDA